MTPIPKKGKGEGKKGKRCIKQNTKRFDLDLRFKKISKGEGNRSKRSGRRFLFGFGEARKATARAGGAGSPGGVSLLSGKLKQF